MRHSHISRGAISSENARRRMMLSGFTPNGHPLWNGIEERNARLYPDYQAAVALNTRRTLVAHYGKTGRMGIAKHRSPNWSDVEILRLRRLYRSASRADLLNALPKRNLAGDMQQGVGSQVAAPPASTQAHRAFPSRSNQVSSTAVGDIHACPRRGHRRCGLLCTGQVATWKDSSGPPRTCSIGVGRAAPLPAERAGMNSQFQNAWTRQEIDIACDNRLTPQERRSRLPNRTSEAIKACRVRMRAGRAKKRWLPAEDETIRTFYPDRVALTSLLPGRTWKAIVNRAERLNCHRSRRAYTHEDFQIAKIVGDNLGLKAAALRLGRTPDAISRIRDLAGVTKRRKARKRPMPQLLVDFRRGASDRGLPIGEIGAQIGCVGLLTSKARMPSYKRLFEAAELLGGTIYAEWDD